MKILKPGKVEHRKFVCDCCGCEFVAVPADVYWLEKKVECPQNGCRERFDWRYGEPYEEPTPTQTDADRLAKLLFDSMPQSSIGRYDLAADNLIANGVTFREG